MEVVSMDERTIAQTIVMLRGLVRIGKMDPPLKVALVVGSSAEAAAWRAEAVDYLTAKAEGVSYLPSTVSIGEQHYDA